MVNFVCNNIIHGFSDAYIVNIGYIYVPQKHERPKSIIHFTTKIALFHNRQKYIYIYF